MSEQAGDVRSVLAVADDADAFLGRSRCAAKQLVLVPQVVSDTRFPLPAPFSMAIFSIASVSGDLSSMTAPPFILSPVSLTEFPGGSTFRQAGPRLSNRDPFPSVLVRASRTVRRHRRCYRR